MIYEILADRPSLSRPLLCTVLDGPGAGAHALFSGSAPVEAEEGFPSGFRPGEDVPRTPCCVSHDGTRLFLETPGEAGKAVICGGGHVAQELIRLLKNLGFHTTVLEDRPSFGEEAARCGADRVMTGSYAGNLAALEKSGETFYVIMTRGHRFDMECLEAVLASPFAYAGMMSSRKRIQAVRKEMLGRGVSEEKLALLHAPIGLEIGAETPEEIAVSVAAEMIREFRARGTRPFPRDILEAVSAGGKKVVALITSRKGPAPREAGTRMVVRENGEITGTIGGGCFEAEVIRKALDLLRTGGKTESVTVDLTAQLNPEEGMACGGRMEVFLEVLGDPSSAGL